MVPIDARADVYGFGVLLYEALTGQAPFPGEPSPALFDRVLHKPAVSLTELRPDLPAGLVRVIEKALAKDREQRFSDVNLMVLALEDELMPPTPAPRLLTPRAGVPLPAGNAPLSGPHAAVVENALNKELSGQHQATRFLYEFPGSPTTRRAPPKPDPTKGGRMVRRSWRRRRPRLAQQRGSIFGLCGARRNLLALGCGLLCGVVAGWRVLG